MSNPETLNFERRDRIAVITLNRPNEANGLNGPLAAELARAAAECDADAALRAVVLTGNGRFFCAGGDVKAMADAGERVPAAIKRFADDLHRAIATFARMAPPLVVAVNGVAAGAGFSLAVAGDLVVASETASFTMAYSNVGLSPDGSSTFYLPRLVGLRRAQELMYLNRKLSAAEALDWGLVHRVVAPAALIDEALRLAQTFVHGSPQSNAAIKKLLLASFGNGLETQLELEGRQIAACSGTPNGREGIRAFAEKRPPRFE